MSKITCGCLRVAHFSTVEKMSHNFAIYYLYLYVQMHQSINIDFLSRIHWLVDFFLIFTKRPLQKQREHFIRSNKSLLNS